MIPSHYYHGYYEINSQLTTSVGGSFINKKL